MTRCLVQILLLLLPFVGFSQDSEQIPLVHEEKHHQPVFENSEFRLLEVSVKSGESCEYHIHKNNITYVAISGAELLMDSLNSGKTREVSLPNGWIGRNDDHAQIPMAHRFTNRGSSDLLIYAVEFLTDNSSDFEIEKLLLEKKSYSIQLKEGEFLFYDHNELFAYSKSNPANQGWLFSEGFGKVYLFKRAQSDANLYCFRRKKE